MADEHLIIYTVFCCYQDLCCCEYRDIYILVLSMCCRSRTDDKVKCDATLVDVAKQGPQATLVITSLSSMHEVPIALYPSQQLVFSIFSYSTVLFFFHSYLTWY